jgi:monoamine oxidase
MQDHFDVVVVGAGSAGIGALRALDGTGLSSIALEARDRVGGRAHTILAHGLPLDIGCGWLHSADVNPLARMIEAAGFAIDRGRPHWESQAGNQDFPAQDQRAFREAYAAFEARMAKAAQTGIDRPGSDFFEAGNPWNPLIDAVSSYYNGAEYDQVSILDYDAYQDTEVNWRVGAGYGAAIASFAPASRIVTDCPVTTIHHDGPDVRLETPKGTVRARAVIVAVPTPLIAEGRIAFSPGLPDKREAAAGLPLGLADKVFLRITDEAGLPRNGHFFGTPTRTETGSYHLRPFDRPYIEGFMGGRAARALEGEGPGAIAAFALEELSGLLGSDIRHKLEPMAETAWAADPWALGSYSHALPGSSGMRSRLAEPVGRLFFAGEATSADAYSTAHGAWDSGERAAREAISALT